MQGLITLILPQYHTYDIPTLLAAVQAAVIYRAY